VGQLVSDKRDTLLRIENREQRQPEVKYPFPSPAVLAEGGVKSAIDYDPSDAGCPDRFRNLIDHFVKGWESIPGDDRIRHLREARPYRPSYSGAKQAKSDQDDVRPALNQYCSSQKRES
jgi:hypothetical protein